MEFQRPCIVFGSCGTGYERGLVIEVVGATGTF